MTDVGMAMNKAEEKTERLRAKSQALDEMINSGVLTDYTSNKDEIEKELEKITMQNSVEEELAKLKSEKQRKKRQQLEQEAQQWIRKQRQGKVSSKQAKVKAHWERQSSSKKAASKTERQSRPVTRQQLLKLEEKPYST